MCEPIFWRNIDNVKELDKVTEKGGRSNVYRERWRVLAGGRQKCLHRGSASEEEKWSVGKYESSSLVRGCQKNQVGEAWNYWLCLIWRGESRECSGVQWGLRVERQRRADNKEPHVPWIWALVFGKDPWKIFNREITRSNENRMNGWDTRLVAGREVRRQKSCAGKGRGDEL